MKLFVITSRVPWPLEKGDKLRIYHQLKCLAEKHEITLCCLSSSEPDPVAEERLNKICKKVVIIRLSKVRILLNLFFSLFSRKPFQVHYFYQARTKRKVHALISQSKPDHIYCQLIRATEYVKNIHTIPKTLDYMDAFNKNVERRIHNSKWYMRPILIEEARRLLEYENLIFEYFEGHTIISEQDQQLIRHPNRSEIAVVANGVDFDFFTPKQSEKKFMLLFTGNMNYPPNVDSAVYLAQEILPIIRKKYPECNLMLAGANPAQKVKALENSHVSVSGWMEDIRDAYNASSIFIAPMKIGSGLQNKLLEAMSMELPCITSELANNALHAKEGKEILIGKTAEQYANLVLGLIENQDQAQSLAKAGRNHVKNNFSWESADQILQHTFEQSQLN